MSRFFRIVLFIYLTTASINILAQGCYLATRLSGIAEMNNKNWRNAITLFEQAYMCPDRPQNMDLDALIMQCKERLKPNPEPVKYDIYNDALVKKAKEGEALAQYSLGLCYENGVGIEKNDSVALFWYKEASLQGNANAVAKVNDYNKRAKEERNKTVIQTIINNMVQVEGGSFIMGPTSNQRSDADNNEFPLRKVTVPSYSIGKYEVTQEEWEAVMDYNPSQTKGLKLPVTNVSWDDCQLFIKKLNELTNQEYHLPTEAEWEYAARGGKYTKECKYAGSNTLDSVAWYGATRVSCFEVGKKLSNELGLFDMSGNVEEWCLDSWGKYTFQSAINIENNKQERVSRGGNWSVGGEDCRIASRKGYSSNNKTRWQGFRLAMGDWSQEVYEEVPTVYHVQSIINQWINDLIFIASTPFNSLSPSQYKRADIQLYGCSSFMCESNWDDTHVVLPSGLRLSLLPMISIKFIDIRTNKKKSKKLSIRELMSYFDKNTYIVDHVEVESIKAYQIDDVKKGQGVYGGFAKVGFYKEHVNAIVDYQVNKNEYKQIKTHEEDFNIIRGISSGYSPRPGRDELSILEQDNILIVLGDVSLNIYHK